MLRARIAGEARARIHISVFIIINLRHGRVLQHTWKCRDKPKSVDYGKRTRPAHVTLAKCPLSQSKI